MRPHTTIYVDNKAVVAEGGGAEDIYIYMYKKKLLYYIGGCPSRVCLHFARHYRCACVRACVRVCVCVCVCMHACIYIDIDIDIDIDIAPASRWSVCLLY